MICYFLLFVQIMDLNTFIFFVSLRYKSRNLQAPVFLVGKAG